MKRLFLFIIILFSTYLSYNQNKYLPQRKYDTSSNYSKMRRLYNNYFGDFAYILKYNRIQFNNEIFSKEYTDKNINDLGNYSLSFQYTKLLPLFISLNYTNNYFYTKKPYFSFLSDEKINFKGFEVNSDFVLLPAFYYFVPYVGVGYGFYEVSSTSLFDQKANRYINENFQSGFYNLGTIINLHRLIFLTVQYKKTFGIDKPFDYFNLNFGLGLHISRDYYDLEDLYDNYIEYIENYPFEFGVGYSFQKMLNNNYVQNLYNTSINSQIGYYVGLKYSRLFPLTFGLNYQGFSFKTLENYYDYLPNENITLNGLQAKIDIALPFYDIIIPYAGISSGYYWYSPLKTFNNTTKQANIAVLWQAGLQTSIGERFFINLEYSETFKKSDKFSFSRINAGLGFRIDSEEYFKGDAKYEIDNTMLLLYGYHQTNFENKIFREHLKNKEIKRSWGYFLNARFTFLFPLLIDFGFFSSQYKIVDIPTWPNADSIKVRHRGFELSPILPLFTNSEFFIPYVGGGYQLSHLYVGPPVIQESGVDYSSIIEMSRITSSPIYKVGLMFVLEDFIFAVEYKHSIFNTQYPYNQLSINIGTKF